MPDRPGARINARICSGSWGRGRLILLFGGYQHSSISLWACAIYARGFVIISCTGRVLRLGAGRTMYIYIGIETSAIYIELLAHAPTT